MLSAPAAVRRRRRLSEEEVARAWAPTGAGAQAGRPDPGDRGRDARDAGQGSAAGLRHDHRRPGHQRPARGHGLLHGLGSEQEHRRHAPLHWSPPRASCAPRSVGRPGVRHTPSLAFVADAVPENARHIDDLLARAAATDAQVAAAAAGAEYAGDADPYRAPRQEAWDEGAGEDLGWAPDEDAGEEAGNPTAAVPTVATCAMHLAVRAMRLVRAQVPRQDRRRPHGPSRKPATQLTAPSSDRAGEGAPVAPLASVRPGPDSPAQQTSPEGPPLAGVAGPDPGVQLADAASRRPRGSVASAGARSLKGIVLIDKPAGWTSHDVVSRVRRILGTRRVGHAGPLDPDARPRACSSWGSAGPRGCWVTSAASTRPTPRPSAWVGRTVTDDAQGAPLGGAPAHQLTLDDILPVVEGLTGPILQQPSSVSAIKVDGRRSHARVRAGEAVDLPRDPCSSACSTSSSGAAIPRPGRWISTSWWSAPQAPTSAPWPVTWVAHSTWAGT